MAIATDNKSGKRQVTGTVDAELYTTVMRVAGERGMTREAVLTRAFALLLEDLCEPVPEATRHALEQPFINRRGKNPRTRRPPLFPNDPS